MEIVIKIPKEFEEHFKSDRFEDSLQRVRFDIHKSIIGNKNELSGNYEIETLDMLTEAFLNGTPLPKGHGRIMDVDKVIKKMEEREEQLKDDRSIWETAGVETALDMFGETIIEADEVLAWMPLPEDYKEAEE